MNKPSTYTPKDRQFLFVNNLYAGEKASKIWEWWKIKWNTCKNVFPKYLLAIRLVVLTQISSCAVERVFSRLKLIREVCDERLYEDMTEIRVLLQCNGDLQDLLSKLSI